MESLHIRRARPEDAEAIHAVHESAFGRIDEAWMVASLEAAGAVVLSLVAERDREVVGHVLFSPVSIDGPAGRFGAVGLAPLAVRPGQQRGGVGSLLVRTGLDELRTLGHTACVVLGHVAYYPRFGFEPAWHFDLRWEFGGTRASFMAVELVPGALRGRSGVVRYRPELGGRRPGPPASAS
jgi:putative acetyltransferase